MLILTARVLLGLAGSDDLMCLFHHVCRGSRRTGRTLWGSSLCSSSTPQSVSLRRTMPAMPPQLSWPASPPRPRYRTERIFAVWSQAVVAWRSRVLIFVMLC